MELRNYEPECFGGEIVDASVAVVVLSLVWDSLNEKNMFYVYVCNYQHYMFFLDSVVALNLSTVPLRSANACWQRQNFLSWGDSTGIQMKTTQNLIAYFDRLWSPHLTEIRQPTWKQITFFIAEIYKTKIRHLNRSHHFSPVSVVDGVKKRLWRNLEKNWVLLFDVICVPSLGHRLVTSLLKRGFTISFGKISGRCWLFSHTNCQQSVSTKGHFLCGDSTEMIGAMLSACRRLFWH